MSQRVTAILLVALLVSGLATFLVYRVVSSRPASVAPVTAQVVTATRQLDIGTVIADKDLKISSWTGLVPKGMATKKEGLVGRGVIATVYEGEPIVETRLAEPGAGGGLAATIPPGMRAVALRVNDVAAVAGFVLAGSKVDILISGIPPGGSVGGPRVKTLLQNIEVLSAGQNYQKDAEGKPVLVPVVNVLVTPSQAEILSLASNETRIQLVLRNPLDTEQAKPPGTVVANLYNEGGKPPAPLTASAAPRPRPAPVVAPPPPAPERPVVVVLPPLQVEVLNGPNRSEASFPRQTEEKKK
jgi:pilus assembly protein CpaB